MRKGSPTQDLIRHASAAFAVAFVTTAALAAALVMPAQRASLPEEADVARAQSLSRGALRVLAQPSHQGPAAGELAVPIPEPAPEPAAPAPEAAAASGTPDVPPEPVPPPPPPTPRPATPRPVVAPPAPVPAVGSATALAEQRTLALMNASRAQAGLAPYLLDLSVSVVARAHSQVESQYGYVYHDGPDGTAASRNRPACGTGWWSENTGKVWNEDVGVLHREFMAEPWAPINHRTNIMDASFTRVGIGAVQGRDAMYLTVVFCR